MGFTPAEVDAMSSWEYVVAKRGYERAHNPDPGPQAPSPDDHDRMIREHG